MSSFQDANPNVITETNPFNEPSELRDVSQASAITQSPSYLPWDNPHNIVSQQARDVVSYVLSCGLSQLLCVLGIPGNVLNMAVFAKQGLTDRVNFLLFVLAVSDTVLLTALLVYKARCYLEPVDLILSHNVDAIMGVSVYYLVYMFSSISQFLVAILSVDRCVFIVFPFVARRVAKFRYVASAACLTFLFFIGIFVPHFFVYTWDWFPDPKTNRSVVLLKETDFGEANRKVLYALARDLNILAVKPIGTVLVVTCSMITLIQIKRAKRTREDLTSTRAPSPEAKITRMLLFVSAISVTCVLPEIAVAFTNMFVPEFEYFKNFHNLVLLMFNVIFLAWSINSSVNFLIYVTMSSKFRATLVVLVPCLRRCVGTGKRSKKNGGRTSATQSNESRISTVSTTVRL